MGEREIRALARAVAASHLPPLEERVRIRERAKVSRTELAEVLGVTRNKLAHWEFTADPQTREERRSYRLALELLDRATRVVPWEEPVPKSAGDGDSEGDEAEPAGGADDPGPNEGGVLG